MSKRNLQIVNQLIRSVLNFRRQVKKSKSVIQLLLFNENTDDDVKCKNIKQTEILVDLREAILQVTFLMLYREPCFLIFVLIDSKTFFTS